MYQLHVLRHLMMACIMYHALFAYYITHNSYHTHRWTQFVENIGAVSTRYKIVIRFKLLASQTFNYLAIDNIETTGCDNVASKEQLTISCPQHRFQCDTDECLDMSVMCDFKRNCRNGRDEEVYCGKLPHGAMCDFRNSTCKWRQNRGRLFWRLANSSLSLLDHFSSEFYIYLNTENQVFASYGVLRSPWFPPIPHYHSDNHSSYYAGCILRYALFLSRSYILTLSVFYVDATYLREEIWSDHGSSEAGTWNHIAVRLPFTGANSSSYRYYLEILASKTFGDYGFVAVTNLSLSPQCFAINVPTKLQNSYNTQILSTKTDNISTSNLLLHNRSAVYKFTSCDNRGFLGPTQGQCNRHYASSNVRVLLKHRGVQIWRVPATSTYTLITQGASGGDRYGLGRPTSPSSLPALTISVLKLPRNSYLYIIVGQQGTSICTSNQIKPILGSVCYAHYKNSLTQDTIVAYSGSDKRYNTSATHDVLSRVASIPVVYPGPGGGGGTFIYHTTGSSKDLQLVSVAAGGDGVMQEVINSEQSNVSYRRQITSYAYSDILPLLNGSPPCSRYMNWRTYGGFGAGEGGCTAPGRGGGLYKNELFDLPPDYISEHGSVASGIYSRIISNSNYGSGKVLITSVFQGCACKYRCTFTTLDLSQTACICPRSYLLHSDGRTCVKIDGGSAKGLWFIQVKHLLIMFTICFLAVIFLCLLVIIYYGTYRRKRALVRQRMLTSTHLMKLYDVSGNMITEYNTDYEFSTALPSSVGDLAEVDKQHVLLSRQLGQGAFCHVFEGTLNSPDQNSHLPVAVKVLSNLSCEDTLLDFVMEAVILSKFDHENIIKLLGVSFSAPPKYIILEYLPGGDLKTFLKQSSELSRSKHKITILTSYVLDVARACEYLESLKFIHRDIAARNCLLTCSTLQQQTVKIADFGMSKQIYSKSEYYQRQSSALIPIKWMPPEAFLQGIFGFKTDCWSFAILTWEIFTLGDCPYPGKTNSDVMKAVMEGERLEQPPLCPDKLYHLMRQCWSADVSQRPSFEHIRSNIEALT